MIFQLKQCNVNYSWPFFFFKEHKIPISSIKVLVSLECLVAVGFRNGAVVVYKVPFQENQEVYSFNIIF